MVRKQLRDGTTREYHYAWRGGPRLPEPDDQRAYLIAYAEAIKARAEPVRRAPRTVADLITAYRRSDRYAALAPATRQFYERRLDDIEDRFGDLPVDALPAKGMRAEIRAWHAEHPATRYADTQLETLRALLGWALEHDLVEANPTNAIKDRHKRVDHSDTVWTPDELRALFDAANAPCRRVCVVAAYTGLRLGDVIGLTWVDVDLDAGVIDRPTNKSRGKARAVVPILSPVRAVIEEGDRTAPTVIVNTWGKPWTIGGIQTAIHRAKAACGVDKRFHDLRGTAATMFARAGLAAPEIARIMGWGERRVEEIIRRYVSRRETAAAIVRRVEG